MTFYFSFIVVVLSVSLMNSVTVLLVEVAREQSETKRAIENKIKGMRTQGFDSWYQSDVPRFRFLRIRKGNTEAELEMIPDAVRDELLNITGKGTVNDVFELLDDDKSGREVRRGPSGGAAWRRPARRPPNPAPLTACSHRGGEEVKLIHSQLQLTTRLESWIDSCISCRRHTYRKCLQRDPRGARIGGNLI